MFLKVNFLIIIFQKKIIFKQNKEFLSIKKYIIIKFLNLMI